MSPEPVTLVIVFSAALVLALALFNNLGGPDGPV